MGTLQREVLDKMHRRVQKSIVVVTTWTTKFSTVIGTHQYVLTGCKDDPQMTVGPGRQWVEGRKKIERGD